MQVYRTVPSEQATARWWRAWDVACFAVPVCFGGKLLNSPNRTPDVAAEAAERGIDDVSTEVQVVAVGC